MQSTMKELDGADGTGEEEQKIEIAIALVKKVSFWIVCRWSREDSFDLFFCMRLHLIHYCFGLLQ